MKVFTCFYAFFGIGTVGLMLSTGVAFFLEKHQKQVLGAVEKAVNKALKKVKGEGEGEEESDSSSDDDDDDDLVNLDPTGWNSRAVWRVCLALILMLGVLGSGIIVLVFVEGMTYVDALYTACISVSTIGYGDYSFQTVEGRVFAIFWLLAGTVVIGWCFVELTNAKLETQKQILQKQLIARNIKEEDFMVADLDKDSRIHESEFIVFKLREMSRVTDEEIKTLRERFRVLDKNQDGVLEMTKSGHYM
ncbi:hypothetical protein CBR_g45236 [Chara braunii]|uniref:EF-hand domain-containing protein n=1 Tax=Chara braunii TaxID=69332 RepID=A0A388K3A6_CHABU|nr:hypothetical protein CBR_g45236 [Chara braunii]|eukprot:GBG64540.1 hypothetical protein CBR_g45236 [Chara braunii]